MSAFELLKFWAAFQPNDNPFSEISPANFHYLPTYRLLQRKYFQLRQNLDIAHSSVQLVHLNYSNSCSTYKVFQEIMNGFNEEKVLLFR